MTAPKDRTIYIVKLRGEAGIDDAAVLRGLRRWLKAAGRGYHLQCVGIRAEPQDHHDAPETNQ